MEPTEYSRFRVTMVCVWPLELTGASTAASRPHNFSS
jgi:hypothetical protein